MSTEYRVSPGIKRKSRSHRYYRNAVERHWDPHDIDLERDYENFMNSQLLQLDLDAMGFEDGLNNILDSFRQSIAMFGAGEDAVTEDLSPLAVVLEDLDDQMFITTQLYEESKHADFFDRYWDEVIHPIEEDLGFEESDPRDDKWFNEPYKELFRRNKEATHLLLTEDTPENRVRAYCHYHMTIEGVLAQSGYYGLHSIFGDEDIPVIPTLPGLDEGIKYIRSDEGRHVGFGMSKIKQHVKNGDVKPEFISNLMDELVNLVVDALDYTESEDEDDRRERISSQLGVDVVVDVPTYAREKHKERMNQVLSATNEIPDVDKLTAVD